MQQQTIADASEHITIPFHSKQLLTHPNKSQYHSTASNCGLTRTNHNTIQQQAIADTSKQITILFNSKQLLTHPTKKKTYTSADNCCCILKRQEPYYSRHLLVHPSKEQYNIFTTVDYWWHIRTYHNILQQQTTDNASKQITIPCSSRQLLTHPNLSKYHSTAENWWHIRTFQNIIQLQTINDEFELITIS